MGLEKHAVQKDTAAIICIRSEPTFFPNIYYLEKSTKNYIVEAVQTCFRINIEEDKGDVLVFMPGNDEVYEAIREFYRCFKEEYMYAIAWHADSSNQMQIDAIEPSLRQKRRIIFAASAMMKSTLIEGITYVVDVGLCKLNHFDPSDCVRKLRTQTTSKISAMIRNLKACRNTSPGKCFRLMTEEAFSKLPLRMTMELHRADISWPILLLKAIGIQNFLGFEFITPPHVESVRQALDMLYCLNILDEDCNLTEDGRTIASLPLEPRLARCLLSSVEMGCSADVLTIATMCCFDNPFILSKGNANVEYISLARSRLKECKQYFRSGLGDHLTLLNVYHRWERANFEKGWCDSHCLRYRIMEEARDIRSYLSSYLKEIFKDDRFATRGDTSDSSSIIQSFVTGYFANAAQLIPEGLYKTLRGKQKVKLHSTSVYYDIDLGLQPPDWVMYHELAHRKRLEARIVSKVDPKWFLELSSHYYGV